MTYKRRQSTEEKTVSLIEKLIGFIIAVFIVAAILYWYNTIVHQPNIGFWKWTAVAVATVWLRDNPLMKWSFKIAFPIFVILQVLAWVSIISLPLIK